MSIPATLTTWDYVALCLMIAFSTLLGFYHVFKAKKSKDTKEFLVSGKLIGFFPVVLSTVATAISPISMQGYPLEIYTYGVHFMLTSFGSILSIPLFTHVFLPVYYNLGVSSIFQYLEYRFNRPLRIVASVMSTVQMVIYTSCIIYAPSLALNQVTGLHLWGSVISIGLVCIIYTALGGIKAVIWADVIQLVILLSAIFIVLIKGCIDVGGVAKTYERAVQGNRLTFYIKPDPTSRDTIWTNIIGAAIGSMAFLTSSQMYIQRFMSNPNIVKARRSLYWACFGSTATVFISFVTGFVMYAKYHDCDPYLSGTISARDQMVPLFAVETLKFAEGLSGIYVAGVLCASLSTLSSVLNSLSAVTLTDYVRPLYPHLRDETAKVLSKVFAAVYGVICIAFVAVAANMGGVVRAMFIISGAFGGPLFTIFALGVLFPWATGRGAMAGFCASIAVGVWTAIGSLISDYPIPTAPLSVEGCNATTSLLNSTFTLSTALHNSSGFFNNTEEFAYSEPIVNHPTTDTFFLYTLSPLWYSGIAGIVGLVVGLAVSIATGVQDPEEIDARLISPTMESLYRKFPEKVRLFLGYKSEKVKMRCWDMKMDYEEKDINDGNDVKLPLKEKEGLHYELLNGNEKISNGIS